MHASSGLSMIQLVQWSASDKNKVDGGGAYKPPSSVIGPQQVYPGPGPVTIKLNTMTVNSEYQLTARLSHVCSISTMMSCFLKSSGVQCVHVPQSQYRLRMINITSLWGFIYLLTAINRRFGLGSSKNNGGKSEKRDHDGETAHDGSEELSGCVEKWAQTHAFCTGFIGQAHATISHWLT